MTSRRLSPLAIVLAFLLVVAGCSAEGDPVAGGPSTTAAAGAGTTSEPETGDGDDGTTTTTGDDGTTTTTGDETTTTTRPRGGGDLPSTAELEALLPTLADLPNGFRDVTGEEDDDEDEDEDDEDDEDDAAFEAAMLENCPGMANLEDSTIFDPEDDTDEDALAEREFEGPADQDVGASIKSSEKMPPGGIDFIVDAFADCKPFTAEADGAIFTVNFDVKREDLGDGGLRLVLSMTVQSLVGPLDIRLEGVMWTRGPVAASVMATTGIDDDTFEMVDIENGLLDRLATDLDEGLADLLD